MTAVSYIRGFRFLRWGMFLWHVGHKLRSPCFFGRVAFQYVTNFKLLFGFWCPAKQSSTMVKTTTLKYIYIYMMFFGHLVLVLYTL